MAKKKSITVGHARLPDRKALDDNAIVRLKHGNVKVKIPLPLVQEYLGRLGIHYAKYVRAAENAVDATKAKGLRGTAAKLYATKFMCKELNEAETNDFMPWRYKSFILDLVYIIRNPD